MENFQSDLPQAKASRQQPKVSHEFCQGYVDKNGIWNNGFYCRRWGPPDETYCCGNGKERFCCPEQTQSTPHNSDFTSTNYIPIIAGVSVGLLLMTVGIFVGCSFCSSCPGYKLRRKTNSKRQIVIGRTLSVSMEAEATSAVIAAQALVPLQGCAAHSQGSTSDGSHLHCGCRWSPPESSTTAASSMHQPNVSWKSEMDNFFNSFSCDIRPTISAPLKDTSQPEATSRLANSSARTNKQQILVQSPMDINFRSNCSSSLRDSSDGSKRATLERTDPHSSSLRRPYDFLGASGFEIITSDVIDRDTRSAGVLPFNESDRYRRDSGVLIEDHDPTGSGNSMLAVVIPAIELITIGREMDVGALGKE